MASRSVIRITRARPIVDVNLQRTQAASSTSAQARKARHSNSNREIISPGMAYYDDILKPGKGLRPLAVPNRSTRGHFLTQLIGAPCLLRTMDGEVPERLSPSETRRSTRSMRLRLCNPWLLYKLTTVINSAHHDLVGDTANFPKGCRHVGNESVARPLSYPSACCYKLR